ncbi:putative pumilio homolog 7, chloroplastic [Asparagus officinalis]|uniref:putative pumilio homolog 7, chloroplastic n=1 Tax=Asparagus officinalis TaxID=4686 RepID=UPI00098E14DE|nr:putative pumilio homolog 7, chloroplastic [Asparagus officinalis]
MSTLPRKAQARVQACCREVEEGRRQDVDRIFNGIIGHVADLMMNPFGNYLVQKLLDVCTEEQRMKIVLKLTQDPSEIIRVSLNTHGTRAVQKLIETLKTQQQIRLVVSALKPGFLNLIKDLNGNHVVQRCLQSLSAEDNQFIFDAAAKYCVDIATHRHGCCVLQRCITFSTGEYRAHLVNEIAANGLLLAQDAFGNYVVQFILDLKNPSAASNLASQFEGNYVHLSTQKFSSNVVEKCLKLFTDNAQARIVIELLSVNRFEMLLQDPYANYVIQSALAHTKGPLNVALVNAIRPHAAILRTSPYCKRIFSRTQLRK